METKDTHRVPTPKLKKEDKTQSREQHDEKTNLKFFTLTFNLKPIDD